MGLVKKLVGWILILVISLLVGGSLILNFLYQPLTSGTIYLDNAKGQAEVIKEKETGIPHVYASSKLMAVYTEGFIHG
jgi:acyl-homoserine lactone acylase PvdQ